MVNKAVAAAVGVAAGLTVLGALSAAARAQVPKLQVAVMSNPIRTKILVDDVVEVTTPKTLVLSKGVHTFKAVAKSPDTLLTYQFDKWTVNGRAVAYDTPVLRLNVVGECEISAEYMLAASGVYPIITTMP